MNPLTGLNEGQLIVYSTLGIGIGVLIFDALGLIDVVYDLPLVTVFLAIIAVFHLYGKKGFERY